MARNVERLQTVVDEISERGGQAQCFSCDITEQSAVQRNIKLAVDTFGSLRGVIANSGVGGANFPGENDRFDSVVQTNVYGTYHTLRAAEAHLIQDGEPTHMVALLLAWRGLVFLGIRRIVLPRQRYSEWFVRLRTNCNFRRRTQVNALCPGWVDTRYGLGRNRRNG